MKLIICMVFVAVCSAAQLPSRSYIPQKDPTFLGSSSQGQSSFQSSSFNNGGSSGLSGGSSSIKSFGNEAVNRRPQQETEKKAINLKLDQEVNENGFFYSYETTNGIKAEESGNSGGTQGGFSYKGDDGITYTITFTADEGGFQAQGAHLPIAPPTPEAILVALQKNAQDEAAGIFDDGKYDAGKYGGGKFSSGLASGQGSFSSSKIVSNKIQTTFDPNSGYRY